MAFLFPMVLGFIIGIGLLAAFQYAMKIKGKKRVTKAKDAALLSKIDIKKLNTIFGDKIPSWISFPEYERVKWLNSELKEIWPFVNKATSEVIKESVEPILEDFCPMGITAMKFQKLTLGSIPPQIGGIKVHKVEEGQIIMDIDFKWGGDPSIILNVSTIAINLPVQLKDLKLFATVRVIFQLCNEIPCIAAVVTSLLSKPKPVVSYTLKAIGGSLTSVPGLASLIDEAVVGALTNTMEWPHRIVTPIVPGYNCKKLEYRLKGSLRVTVVSCSNLKNMDMVGKSDPYVIVWTHAFHKCTTPVIDNNLNPKWDSKNVFELLVDDPHTTLLKIQVMDEDTAGDELIGVSSFPLHKLPNDLEISRELQLMPEFDNDRYFGIDNKLGKTTLMLEYHEFTEEEAEFAMDQMQVLIQKHKEERTGIIGGAGKIITGAGKLVGGGMSMVGKGVGGGVSLVGKGMGQLTKRMTFKESSSPKSNSSSD